MTDPNNGAGEGNQDQPISKEAFEKLSSQVENLNKGIASERSANKQWESKYNDLKKEVDGLKISKSFPSDDDDEILLNPDDEKRLKAWAQKQGFVSKTEFEAEKQKMQLDTIKTFENQAVTEFLEKHPEYDDDENWNKVLSQFQLYRQPTSLDSYRKLLNKIHKELTGEEDKSKSRDEGRTKEKIENIKKSRLSLGGGNQRSDEDNSADLETLQKRYPNLSKDQISQRLTDIRSLYPKK